MNIKTLGNKIKGNPSVAGGTVFSILIIIGIGHFLNDMIQSVVPSIYPILKDKFGFSFAQIGIITFVFQISSSILQPLTGLYADRHPRPYSLSVGMCFTLVGLLLLAVASSYALILLSVAVIGIGSSVFHPEASRVAQMASGGRKSLAQSIFQVGGNGGSALGPLLAAAIVLPFGQGAISWFALAAILAAVLLLRVGYWYSARLAYQMRNNIPAPQPNTSISRRRKYWALLILVLLIFSKYFYTACMTSYFTFFLIDKFHVSVATSQLCLFAFLAAFEHRRRCPLRLGHALCGVCSHRGLRVPRQPYHRLGVLVNRCLCHRPVARQGGTGVRRVLRTDVWSWWPRFSLLWMACRPHQCAVHFRG